MEKSDKQEECTRVLKKLCEELNENINSPFCNEAQTHLQSCPQCRAFVDSIRKTVYFCKNMVDEDVPNTIDEHLWKVLKLDKPK